MQHCSINTHLSEIHDHQNFGVVITDETGLVSFCLEMWRGIEDPKLCFKTWEVALGRKKERKMVSEALATCV